MVIGTVVLGAAVAFITVFMFILLKHKREYSDYVKAVNGKDFKLRHLLPFGLYILDRMGYTFNSAYDRRLIGHICEIYGQEYSLFYTRIVYANKVALLGLMPIFQMLAGLLSGFQMAVHFYLLIIFSALVISDDIKLKKMIEKRRLEIQMEFPEFVNKLTLMLNAGLTMSKAWEKISADCNKKGNFYSEVHKTISEIRGGRNEAESFGEFARRLKAPEISRLMSSIIQNIKKGDRDLVLSMRLQSNECWEMRKNAVRRLGEEASTKLLFPMMIMFLAIVIIVVTPALISMQEITSSF